MSLYSALYAGVSGLGAQASAMATVSDNITNVNTIGYKGVSAQFETMVVGGSATRSYSAGGVLASPKSLISQQGLLQSSNSQTDIGIDGAGFFVVSASQSSGDTISYTRAGSFTTDSSGYLRNSAGYYLMGWPLNSDGTYLDNGSTSALSAIRPNALTGAALPTTNIQMRMNLDSTATPLAPGYTAGDMTSGAITPQFTRSIEVFDEQGTSHTLILNFAKSAANQWVAEISADPSEVQLAPSVTQAGLLASGTIEFNADGSLNLANSSTSLFSDLNIQWANGAGSVPISLSLGTNGGLDGLTQFGTNSALLSSKVDGGMLGTVASVEISDTGVVSAIFDDGTSRSIYQLPIATFQNPNGLTRMSGNSYIASQSSGSVAINRPGALGGGKISAGTLEASTVDLASEFSNMIIFQRAYSASSKIITTVDDMLQEVSNLKR